MNNSAYAWFVTMVLFSTPIPTQAGAPPARDPIATWVGKLSDPVAEVRGSAARALARFGPNAKAAVPALARALRDPDRLVRVEVAMALEKIGPEAKGATSELRAALKDEFHLVRGAVGSALGSIGPAAREAVPDLIINLGDAEAVARVGAIRGLAGIGLASIPALIGASRSGSPLVRSNARLAQDRIDGIVFDERNQEGDPTSVIITGQSIGDPSLEYLGALTALKRLAILPEAAITDAGLSHLARLKSLTYLQINLPSISDAGLVHLRALDRLTELHLEHTKVTAAGVAALQEALPNCKIFHRSLPVPRK